MPIRVECVIPSLEDNWIEVAEAWSRGELLLYMTQQGEPWIELWRQKVTACCLSTVDGQHVTDPVAVHGDARDALDIRLNRFVSSALTEATDYLLTLGEAPKRLLSNGVVVAAPTKTPTPIPVAGG